MDRSNYPWRRLKKEEQTEREEMTKLSENDECECYRIGQKSTKNLAKKRKEIYPDRKRERGRECAREKGRQPQILI